MKILLFERTVSYIHGGVGTHVRDLFRVLQKSHHEVVLMTSWNGKPDPALPSETSYVPNPSLGQSTAGRMVSAAIFCIGSFAKLIAMSAKKKPPNLVIVFFFWEAFVMRFVRLFLGTPYVYILAGDTHQELIEGRRADLPIQISEYMAERCEKEYGYRPIVIPKGIDLSRFCSVADTRIGKPRRLDERSLILTVAGLIERKGLDILIQAAKILAERRRDVRFVVIGNGPLRVRLGKMIEDLALNDSVTLVGSVPYESQKLIAYYQAAKLFVLPTLYEGFGWVFLEAMACRVPIITTNVGSNTEIVGEVGLLIPPKRPDILAETINSLLHDQNMISHMAERGYDRVLGFCWDKVAPLYVEAFLEASSGKRMDFPSRFKRFCTDIFHDLPLLLSRFRKSRFTV